MSEDSCWPENDAVEAWKKKFSVDYLVSNEAWFELKKSVSKYRIQTQAELTKYKAVVEAVRESLESIKYELAGLTPTPKEGVLAISFKDALPNSADRECVAMAWRKILNTQEALAELESEEK